jgi:hypothetical protein
VGDGTVEELRSRAKTQERARVSVAGDASEAENLLRGLNGARRVERVDEKEGFTSFLVFGDVGKELWREVGQLARTKDWELRELADQPLSLEETFLLLTEPVEATAESG